MATLALSSISKTFGTFSALKRVSMEFIGGERVLLLGPNGAGKSTLLRIAAGLTKQNSGSVQVEKSTRIAFASHHLLLYPRLTVRENLRLFSSVSGHSDIEGCIQKWGLEGLAEKAVADLSKGGQARVSLARGMIGDPSLILLDEPTSNLDDRGVALLTEQLLAASDADTRGTVVVATHDLHRLRALATRIVVLQRGEIVGDTGPNAPVEIINQAIAHYQESNR